MKDCFGKELSVGDKVAYPGRSGSMMWMNSGEIVDILDGSLKIFRKPDNSYQFYKMVTVMRVDRVVKI